MNSLRVIPGKLGQLNILLLLFFFTFLLLIIRNLFLNHPVVFGDEYLYKEFTKHNFNDLDFLFTRGLLKPDRVVPSYLYYGIYYFTLYAQESSHEAAQVLNSLFFSLALFPIYGTARIFVAPRAALLIAFCAAISPYSIHTVYFMPEAQYYFLFWVLVYFFFKWIGSRPHLAGAGSGVVLSLLFLTKPHGIMMLGAVNLVLLTLLGLRSRLDLKVSDVTRAIIWLNLVFIGLTLPLRYALSGEFVTIMGSRYQNEAGHILDWQNLNEIGSTLLFVATRHVSFLLFLYGVPIFVTIWGLFYVIKQEENPRIEQIALPLLAFLTLLIPLAITIKSQRDWSLLCPAQAWRVHGRYYNFMLPLFLISFFTFYESWIIKNNLKAKFFVPLASGLGGLWLILAWPSLMAGRELPVVDFPEVSGLTRGLSNGQFYGMAVVAGLILIYFGFVKVPKCSIFLTFFVGVSLLGSVFDFQSELIHARSKELFGQTAQTVEGLLNDSEHDNGLVVVSQKTTAWHFLFSFGGTPFVRILPLDHAVDVSTLPAGVSWILLLDKHNLNLPSSEAVSINQFRFVSLEREQLASSNASLVTISPGVADTVRLASQLTVPWDIETRDSKPYLWLGHGSAKGLQGTLWSTKKQPVQVEFRVSAGPGRADNERTLELALNNGTGIFKERLQFNKVDTITLPITLVSGENEFSVIVLDESTIQPLPNGDPRSPLVRLNGITIRSQPE